MRAFSYGFAISGKKGIVAKFTSNIKRSQGNKLTLFQLKSSENHRFSDDFMAHGPIHFKGLFFGGGLFSGRGGWLFSVGLILGVKNKSRNAWAYTRGKNSW